MIHPHTALRLVNDEVGLGIFATRLIPAGTIVYVRCELDVLIEPTDPLVSDPRYRAVLERYAYVEPTGLRVLCFDHGKYENHACDPNTLTTGFGFDIAVRDIAPGEEMTSDYACLNIEEPMPCCCGAAHCRGVVRPDDLDRLHAGFDARCIAAIARLRATEQPMMKLMDASTKRRLNRYLRSGKGYPTSRKLRHVPKPATAPSPRVNVAVMTGGRGGK